MGSADDYIIFFSIFAQLVPPSIIIYSSIVSRFMRELEKLKRLADYSSMDSTGLKSVLHSVGPELTVYTYPMLKAGVDSDSIR